MPKLLLMIVVFSQFLISTQCFGKAYIYLPAQEIIDKAEAGDAYAEAILSIYYTTGEGNLVLDKEKSKEILQRALNKEHPMAYYVSAANYTFVPDSLKDLKKAKEHINKALPWILEGKKNNDGYRISLLATIYDFGIGVERDYKKSREYAVKATKLGDPRGAFVNAISLVDHGSIPLSNAQQEEKARLLKIAVDGSYTQAIHFLGDAYLNGIGVPQNSQIAMTLYHRSADLGYVKSMRTLFTLYGVGINVLQNSKKSFSWLQKAADRGDNISLTALGLLHLSGKDVPLDTALGFTYLNMVTEPSSFLYNTFAIIAERGWSGGEKDIQKSIEYHRKAMELGDTQSIEQLAYYHFQGVHGLKKSNTIAMEFLTKSEKFGSTNAAYQIGLAYYNGNWNDDNSAPDYRKAFLAFKRGEDFKNPDCLDMLGSHYFMGLGVVAKPSGNIITRTMKKIARTIRDKFMRAFFKKGYYTDYKIAFEYFQQSSELGSGFAQYNLSVMYYNGYYVEKNEDEGLKWVKLSAESGYDSAIEFLKGIE